MPLIPRNQITTGKTLSKVLFDLPYMVWEPAENLCSDICRESDALFAKNYREAD